MKQGTFVKIYWLWFSWEIPKMHQASIFKLITALSLSTTIMLVFIVHEVKALWYHKLTQVTQEAFHYKATVLKQPFFFTL